MMEDTKYASDGQLRVSAQRAAASQAASQAASTAQRAAASQAASIARTCVPLLSEQRQASHHVPLQSASETSVKGIKTATLRTSETHGVRLKLPGSVRLTPARSSFSSAAMVRGERAG